MRRAITAGAATVAGLVALLGYKSSSPIKQSTIAVGVGGPGAASGTPTTGAAPTAAPASTTTPASVGPSAPPSTTPPTTPPTTVAPTTAVPSTGSFTGQDISYFYGDIQVSITLQGSKITRIDIPREGATDQRSQFINSQAVPILTKEAMAAQGVHIYVVSGATYTSDAFAQALETTLKKAGRK